MKNDEWLTPPEILKDLGRFHLDPCAPHRSKRPWSTADFHYSQDGLTKEWFGRVWLNPPFGSEARQWIKKLAAHGNGIALLPARTETAMFFESVWPEAHAILFIKSRPRFHFVDGTRAKFNSGAPICLVAYGAKNALILKKSNLGKALNIQ